MATSNSGSSIPCFLRRIIPNIHVVWLDENINENNVDYHKSIEQLRQVVHTVNIFVNIDECIDFITDRSDETVFMITSQKYIQQLCLVVTDLSQIKSIYIFSQINKTQTKWNIKCSKINDTFTDIASMCEAIKQDLKDNNNNNTVSISFANSAHETSNTKNKGTLDCSFMYTQILKEILLTIDFNQQHFEDFLTFCRDELTRNTNQLTKVDKIQNEYHNRKPIWWYTCESFLYSMVNTALRVMDIDIIVKMGFFVCDLHKNITDLHAEQFNGLTFSDPFSVYRGQGLSQADFVQLKDNTGGLVAFNNFLSTSKNRQVSLRFIRRAISKSDLVPVLFVMHIAPSIQGTPFADITDVSAVKSEEEILFSMHSVFRIGQMKKLDSDNRIWEMELTLTSDNDSELQALTQNVKEKISNSTGWHQLGLLLIRLHRFNKAEELYEILLREANCDIDKACFLQQLGQIYDIQGKYATALEYNKKSLEIMERSLPENHRNLASCYNNIASVYENIGEYSKALEYLQKALETTNKNCPANPIDLAVCYNNIAGLYETTGENSKALGIFTKVT